MPDGTVPLLLALIALVICSGFFSSTETAFSCASPIKLRVLATNGKKRAKKVLDLTENNYDKFITTILVGNNIVNLSAATLSTIFFARLLGSLSDGEVSVISTVAITLAVLIFGEITPKMLAKIFPEKTAMAFYPIVIVVYYILYPFNIIFSGWKWLITKIFRIKSDDVVTEDEIMTVVEEAEEDGTIRNDETKLIRSVIEFDDVEVGDILVPRVNIVATNINASMDEVRKIFEVEGYSRIPVYKDSIDTIVGTIHEKDFYNAYNNGVKNIGEVVQETTYTSATVKISKLLKILQKKKIHLAIVLDEYGGTLGLVTLEDILEELVGEIWDEHDEVINYFKPLSDDSFTVDCNAPLSELFEYIGLRGEDEEFEASTVNGWAIEILGEIPRVGAKTTSKGYEIEVLKSTVKRVLQIKMTKLPQIEED